MDMKDIHQNVNAWLGARTITEDQLKQLIWAFAMDPELELIFGSAVTEERIDLQAEMERAGEDLHGFSTPRGDWPDRPSQPEDYAPYGNQD